MDDGILKQIGAYCRGLSFDEISATAVHRAKCHLLDSIACAFGTFGVPDAPPVNVARKVAINLCRRDDECTIIGTGEKTSVDMAALVNSVMVRYLDFSDYWVGAGRAFGIHPSDNIATALAVAEKQKTSGKELLTAIVLGYEIQMRLANLPVHYPPQYRGWDPNILLAYSVPAVAAKLLGLNDDQIANAISLSASRGITLVQIRRGQIAMDKAFSVGQNAAAAILAAFLAQQGGTGCATLIEGDYGLNKVILGGCDLSTLVTGYDEELITRVNIKPYPAERMNQTLIDAALALRNEHGIHPEEIKNVRVHIHEDAMVKPSWSPEMKLPRTREAADHSFTWNIAKALVDGEMTIKQFTLDPLSDPRVVGLLEKVEFVTDPEMSDLHKKDPTLSAARMEISTARGNFVHHVKYHKGHQKNRLTDDEQVAKLRATASGMLSEEKLSKLVEKTWSLDQIKDVKEEYIPLLVF